MTRFMCGLFGAIVFEALRVVYGAEHPYPPRKWYFYFPAVGIIFIAVGILVATMDGKGFWIISGLTGTGFILTLYKASMRP